MKLITTEYYLLLIDKEAEIKEGNYIYNSEYKKITETNAEYIRSLKSNTTLHFIINKIIAYYPLIKEAKELDLPLLPNPFENTIDIEKLACEKYNIKDGINDYDERYYNSHNVAKAEAFIAGYKAAQSEQFSFTREELESLLLKVIRTPKYFGNNTPQETAEKIIQSLSTQQLPKEFILIYQYKNERGVLVDTNKFENEDCKLKTIANSEGKEELVGTYKY